MSSTEHDTDPVRPVDRAAGDTYDLFDDRPPPPPAAAAWPRDDEPVAHDEPVSRDEAVDRDDVVSRDDAVDRDDVVSRDDAVSRDDWTATDEDADRTTHTDQPVGADEAESLLIDDPEHVRLRWQNVQVGFVDDPRGAIDDAGKLVDEVVDLVVTGVAAQRDRLGETWSADDLDTEQLRLALRRYREFLDRLLAV